MCVRVYVSDMKLDVQMMSFSYDLQSVDIVTCGITCPLTTADAVLWLLLLLIVRLFSIHVKPRSGILTVHIAGPVTNSVHLIEGSVRRTVDRNAPTKVVTDVKHSTVKVNVRIVTNWSTCAAEVDRTH